LAGRNRGTDTAMIVSYIDDRPTRPPLLDLLARQQHARL
jgi:hypothetical protein